MKRSDREIGPDASWSEEYFRVQRSLLVQASEAAEFEYQKIKDKTIIVTKGSTADIDAEKRYRPRGCKILYVEDVVPKGVADAQEYIVRELIAKHKDYAFVEGNVSNQYLGNKYGKDVKGGLALADVHDVDRENPETFNFITRNASSGLHKRLKEFVKDNKDRYAFK
jgi:ABC-type amino acid transport substrate-binding protein